MKKSWLLLGVFFLLASCSDQHETEDERCSQHAYQDQAEVRVFVVQPKLDMTYLESYQTFEQHFMDLVNEKVIPCLSTNTPNLIVFPESIGLPAALIGSRGEEARNTDQTVTAAFHLMNNYEDQIAHYLETFPDASLGQRLQLAVTDTVWRAFFETMQKIALVTNAWVVSSVDISDSIKKSVDLFIL